MPTETVTVRGASDSSYESMTKQDILTAITQAVEEGTIGNLDTGFITIIKEQNKGLGLKFWVGTTAEYEALTTKENNALYIKTDDTSVQDINNALTTMTESIEEIRAQAARIPIDSIGTSVSISDASEFATAMGYGSWSYIGDQLFETGHVTIHYFLRTE